MKPARHLTIMLIATFALLGVLAPFSHISGQASGAFMGAMAGHGTATDGSTGYAFGNTIARSAVLGGVLYVGSPNDKVFALRGTPACHYSPLRTLAQFRIWPCFRSHPT